MRTSRLVGGLAAAVLLCAAAATEATDWFWLADNHTGTSPNYTSLWSDNVHTFTRLTSSDNWDVYWESPLAGWATVKGGYVNHSGGSGRYILKADFGASSNNPADPDNYWDIRKGLTLAAKIKIPAVDGASGNGSILLGVNNASTAGLISPAGTAYVFCAYLGWDENGLLPGGVGINFWTPAGGRIRPETLPNLGWITPSVNVVGVETCWTLSARRYVDPVTLVDSNTITWDLWIDGVAQAQDSTTGMLGADGNYHTLVGYKGQNEGTSIYIGQRRTQPFNHESQWDHVAITNSGVIPAWCPEVPKPPCESRVSPQDPQASLAIRGRAAEPSAIVYTVQNTGSEGGLTYTVAETDAAGVPLEPPGYTWLSLDKASGGPLDSGASETVTASIIDTDLTAGVYTAYVTFTDSCASPNKYTRRIDLTVIGCRMQLDPDADVYRAIATAKAQVNPVVYTITNTGGGTFSYTVEEVVDQPWLTLDKSGGGPLGYLDSDKVTATINWAGLPLGTYSCELKFTPSCSTSPQAPVESRTIHVSVRDVSSTTQWLAAEFLDVEYTDLAIQTGVCSCPSKEKVADFVPWLDPDRGQIDFYTQGTIDSVPTTLKFFYEGAQWSRGALEVALPLGASYQPQYGMAWVWRMRTGEYNGPGRGPFRVYIPGPVSGSPVAVYFGVHNGNNVRAMTNCCGNPGAMLNGVDPIILAKKISDPLSDPNDPESPRIPTYHVWSASGCYDAGFDPNNVYFNLWVELLDDSDQPYTKHMLFGGTNGSVSGPGGKTYSFRTSSNDGETNPGLTLGEIGNSGSETRWDFEFDYIRAITLDVPGGPYWDGQGGGCDIVLPWPDADEDGDVDQDDFGAFQLCYTGPVAADPLAPSCKRFDRDRDDNIDVLDFAPFQDCTTGPDVPLDPNNLPPGCAL